MFEIKLDFKMSQLFFSTLPLQFVSFSFHQEGFDAVPSGFNTRVQHNGGRWTVTFFSAESVS